MAITVFRISKLPERVDCLKNGNPAILNQSYLLVEQDEISYNNQTGFKNEFLDSMQIEVSEDGVVWSNPCTVAVKELVGINTPESAELIVTGAKNNNYDFTGIQINGSTDRIKITNIEGYGDLTLKGTTIVEGDVVLNYELDELLLEANMQSGVPYSIISYQCGNHLGFNEAVEYQFILNISSLAEITSSGVDGDNPKFDNVIIEKGLSEKIALVTVVVSGTLFANGPSSEIILEYGDTTTTIVDNGTQQISVPLDVFGDMSIELQHNYSNFGTSAVSNVQLTIDSVDGESSNVSATNTYTSTVNF